MNPHPRGYTLKLVLLLAALTFVSIWSIRLVVDQDWNGLAEPLAGVASLPGPIPSGASAGEHPRAPAARAAGAAAEEELPRAPDGERSGARRPAAVWSPVSRNASPGEPALDDRAAAEEWVAREDWDRARAAYRELHLRNPADAAIALRYARLLAWSGAYADAARVMASTEALASDGDLLLEQARYSWWGGDAIAADASLSELLRAQPAHVEALDLREQIRQSAAPSVVVASRWVAERPGGAEHLALGRAYVREGNPARGLRHFRAVLDHGYSADSLWLEFASAALAADSIGAAAEALEQFLRRQPHERDARVRLARTYAQANRTEAALAAYAVLLSERPDAQLRFERAQILAWSGAVAAAEPELRALAEDAEFRGPALKLLGDLARWRQDWRSAERHYAAALNADSSTPGVEEAVGQLGAARQAARTALSRKPERWTVTVESLADSENFNWFRLRTSSAWDIPGGAMATLQVRHSRVAAGDTQPSPVSDLLLYGLDLGVWMHLVGTDVRLHGGFDELGVRRIATWGAGLRMPSLQGPTLTADYDRSGAGQWAGTLAAAEAGSTVERARIGASYGGGVWSGRSEVRWQRFDSPAGGGQRFGGTVSAERVIADQWTAGLGAEALTSDRASPIAPGIGSLYWAPVHYVAPAASLVYSPRLPLFESRVRVSPGVAHVRERELGLRWYGDPWVPFVGLGLELATRYAGWEFLVSGDWTGAPGDAYRAAGGQLHISYTPDNR